MKPQQGNPHVEFYVQSYSQVEFPYWSIGESTPRGRKFQVNFPHINSTYSALKFSSVCPVERHKLQAAYILCSAVSQRMQDCDGPTPSFVRGQQTTHQGTSPKQSFYCRNCGYSQMRRYCHMQTDSLEIPMPLKHT